MLVYQYDYLYTTMYHVSMYQVHLCIFIIHPISIEQPAIRLVSASYVVTKLAGRMQIKYVPRESVTRSATRIAYAHVLSRQWDYFQYLGE